MGIQKRGGKNKHRHLQPLHRKRYKDSFLRRYGVDFLDWTKWKKDHTPQEVNQKRIEARNRR